MAAQYGEAPTWSSRGTFKPPFARAPEGKLLDTGLSGSGANLKGIAALSLPD